MQGPHSKGFARHPLLDLGQLASNPAFESEAAALSNRHTDLTPRRPTPPPTAHPNRHTPTKIAYRPIPHTQSTGKPNRKPRDWSPGAQTDPKVPIKGPIKAGGLSLLVPFTAQLQTKTASSAAAQTASGCHEPAASSATQAVHGLPGLALEAQLQSAVHSKEAADFDVQSQLSAQDPMVPAMTTPHSDALSAGTNVTGTASATATAQAASGLGQSPAALGASSPSVAGADSAKSPAVLMADISNKPPKADTVRGASSSHSNSPAVVNANRGNSPAGAAVDKGSSAGVGGIDTGIVPCGARANRNNSPPEVKGSTPAVSSSPVTGAPPQLKGLQTDSVDATSHSSPLQAAAGAAKAGMQSDLYAVSDRLLMDEVAAACSSSAGVHTGTPSHDAASGRGIAGGSCGSITATPTATSQVGLAFDAATSSGPSHVH